MNEGGHGQGVSNVGEEQEPGARTVSQDIIRAGLDGGPALVLVIGLGVPAELRTSSIVHPS